jgi:hypothetical protein
MESISFFLGIDHYTIQQILDFLESDERNPLLDSCSTFRAFKKDFCFYPLNKECSREYWKSESFRERVNQNIASKRQLTLDFSFTPDIYTVSKKDGFDGVYQLDLSNCLSLKKIKVSNIHCLITRRCIRLKKIKIAKVDVMNISYSCLIRNHFYTWKKLQHLILCRVQYELFLKFAYCLENIPLTFEDFSIREYIHTFREEGTRTVQEFVLSERIGSEHF